MKEEFIFALYHADTAKLRSILDQDKTILAQTIPQNSLDWGPLHLAVSFGFTTVIQLLLEFGIDVNQTDIYGWNAAHITVMNGNLASLKILVGAGISINALTKMHENLLFLATKFNKPNILRFLINEGANLATTTLYQMTPLSIATTKGHLRCLKILLAYKLQQTGEHQQQVVELFKLALTHQQIHIADYLRTRYHIEPEPLMPNPWAQSEDYLYQELYQLLTTDLISLNELQNYLDRYIQQANSTALLIAALRMAIPKYELLASINLFDQLVERLIHREEPHQLIQCLLEGEATTALAIVELIPEVDLLDIDGQKTPLSWLAVKDDDLELLKAILTRFDSQKMLKSVNQNGDSILHFAAQTGAIKIAQYLINGHHLSINEKNSQGESLLHQAIEHGQDAFIRLLLQQYPYFDFNSVDIDNNTPLHIAVIYNRIDCITLLKSAGVNLSAINREGNTPLMIATEQSNHALIASLDNSKKNSSLQYSAKHPIPKAKIAVCQGGGVKGIGLYGSLQQLHEEELLDLSELRIVAGSSAGAIGSLLLALSYNIEELGIIMKNLNFYDLLEENLRTELFQIKSELAKHNGIENFLGEGIFQLINKLKTGELDREYLKRLGVNFIAGKKLPIGLTNNLTKILGIHDDEYKKLEENIERLKLRLKPFIAHFNDYHQGIFAGEVLRKTFVKWIKAKGLDENLTFQMLHELALSNKIYKDLYVTAYNVNESRTEIFSYETTPNAIIADAVRCSMSIQLFFEPHRHYINVNGVRCEHENKSLYFDGGSLDNYMLSYFDKMRYVDFQQHQSHSNNKITNPYVIGFRLLKPEMCAYYEGNGPLPTGSEASSIMDFLLSVASSVISFTKQENDYILNPDEQARTIHINTLEINTVDFDINEQQKEKLVQSGRDAVTAFIKRCTHNQTIQPINYLRKYFPASPLHSYSPDDFLPKDLNARFKEIMKVVRHVTVEELSGFFNELQASPATIRDRDGNTLFHKVVKAGDIILLNKLYQLSPTVNIENNQGMMPIDCVIYCKHMQAREAMLNFFMRKNLWFSKLLNGADRIFNNASEKQRYLLELAYENQNKTAIYKPHAPQQNKKILNFLVTLANSSNEIDWQQEHSKDDLSNYVYILIKNERLSLIEKLGLSIDQADEQGMTALHYLVLENDRKTVEACFSSQTQLNFINHEGDALLDMALKINSYSTEDTILQQQLMIALLINNNSYSCKIENKELILQLMSDFTIIDLKLQNSLENFKNYTQDFNLDVESCQANLTASQKHVGKFGAMQYRIFSTAQENNAILNNQAAHASHVKTHRVE